MNLPIYFISDVHLMLNQSSEEDAKRESLYRFLNFVRTTRGTLFFVGDLFDFYFEYPDMIPKSYFEFYNKAFQLKKAGVDLRFIAGNHDYWVLDFMKEKLMNHTYFDDTTFSLRGKNFYITHGDGVLSWDYGYRLLKRIIRSPFFIWCLAMFLLTVSINTKYGSPVCILVSKIFCHNSLALIFFKVSLVLGLLNENSLLFFTHSMNSSLILMPWCRLRLFLLKSPDGFRISKNSSISGVSNMLVFKGVFRMSSPFPY